MPVRHRALVVLLVAWLVVAPGAAAAAPGAGGFAAASGTTDLATVDGPARVPAEPAARPVVEAVYPDPAAPEDRGEFVRVRFPESTAVGNWTLSDGESVASLPDATVSGAVVLATEPATVRNLADRRVLGLDGHLALSNAGETVTLRFRGQAVDAVTYPAADEGAVWLADARAWRPLGATAFPVRSVSDARVRAFVLPDDPGVPLRTLRAADERILLAGYTLTSRRVAAALRAAAGRGVTVEVLVDASPVGGLTDREAALLDRLARSPVGVRVLGGPRARYEFHHPKYAVVDDRALVASENWKPSGTGGNASRGWGVVVRDSAFAADLRAVFRADSRWRAAVPWREFRRNRSFEPAGPPANGTFPARFPALTARADRVRLLVAPDNAESAVVDLLRSANESLVVEQVSVERGSAFYRETVAAARRGVRVRVLLGGVWYVREENRKTVERLNRLAAEEGLPLEAKLVEPRSRFGKIHVKGAVVDRRKAVVGSLNWNNHSARQNREVAVVLAGDAVGEYYSRVFLADWRGGAWRVTFGMLAGLLVAVSGAVLVGRRRIGFDAE